MDVLCPGRQRRHQLNRGANRSRKMSLVVEHIGDAPCVARGWQIDTDHQTGLPGRYRSAAITQRFQARGNDTSKASGICKRGLHVEKVQRCQCRRTRNRISRVRMPVKELHAIFPCSQERIVHVRPGQRRGKCERSAGDALSNADEIGLQFQLLEREHRSRAAEARRNFIDDQERLHAAQRIVCRTRHEPHSRGSLHDRFDYNRGYVVALQHRRVVICDRLEREGAEPRLEDGDIGKAHRARCIAVIRIDQANEVPALRLPNLLPILQRHFESGFDCARAVRGEERVIHCRAIAQSCRKRLGDRIGGTEGGRVIESSGLPRDRLHDRWMPVPVNDRPDRADRIENGMSARVGQIRTLCGDEGTSRCVEGLHLGERKPEAGPNLNHESIELRLDAAVIIVGGGPVGLSLALGLARYGTSSIVLERNLEPVRESRAVVIWARTQEIYRDWHAYDALRSAGEFVTCFKAINARNGRTLLEIDWTTITDVVADPGVLVLPQNETETVLRTLVAANPLCQLRTGATAEGLRQDSRFVDVSYADAEGRHTIRGAYAVGCDGAHGMTRHALGLSLEGMTYDSRVVLSDEILDRDIDDAAIARVRLDQSQLRAAIRFAPRTWRVIAPVGSDASDEAILSADAHRQRLNEVFGEGVHTTTVWSSLFKIHRRHAQRFIVGRVALAGDAAHLNSPAGGQGMNAGIQDAANLAWKIAFALRADHGGEELLDTYDVERREMITDTIERFTDRLTRVGIGLPRRAKQFVVRTMSRAIRGPGMQRKACRALGMLSGRYTKSPIVDARHPLAGRRIADLRLPDGSRINERRNGDALLVAVGDVRLDMPHVVIPVAPKRWHVKPPVVLIVRPDGCVAAVIDKPTTDRVARAWEMAFCGTLRLPAIAR